MNVGIAEGDNVFATSIEGGWREIDTVQDLARAHAVVDW
jgi:NDP-sugar pyrophosphorylase family protein